jgi:tetratricopeptide (TPR) repeat protein
MDASTPSLREQGIRALDEGRLDEAIGLLTPAAMAEPGDAEARAYLGIAYSRKGLHEQGKRALQEAVSLQPHNGDYRCRLGAVLEAAGDTHGAAGAYRDALQINPGHAEATARLELLGLRHREQPPAPGDPYAPGPAVSPSGQPGGPGAYSIPAAPAAPPQPGPFAAPGVYSPPVNYPPPGHVPPPYGSVTGYGMTPGYSYQKPHRGAVVLALALCGVFVCPIFAVVAWVLGNQDLADMNTGVMDESGRGLTQAGRIIGMVLTLVTSLVVVGWALLFLALMVFAGG